MEEKLTQYQAYLFDMDGTLVDSEPLKGKALALACEAYGASVDYHCYKQVMGESWAVVTGHFFTQAGINPDLKEFNQHFRHHYEQLLSQQLTVHKGAEEYLCQLRQNGKRSALVSSAAGWMVETILKSLQLEHCFEVVITQEDVTKHKPDPEAYLLALERMKLSPAQAIIFEDSYAGICAARDSGCEVVAIKHQFNPQNDLSSALLAIDDYCDLLV
ncbi:HAD family phosphatase [Vibrio sp. SCSIO 43136]|uniref:HAD family hydrolase n=1 Tax=Vibrio sp. SCSIO 43136 TaxID=2819101 RepID=UPI00207594AA|nr:HAD family phosphatase [Vibrio sp. SCSIO 43136]USD66983.1 HAD family phosphatase [Vibrio sp. SCSIO 43136]